MAQSRVDHTLEKTFRTFISPDLLIMDDFGLQKLTAQQSTDLYELIIARHRQSSFAFTSNRSVEEWLGLFDDPILVTALWTGWQMPAIRLLSKDRVTGRNYRRTGERRY